MLTMGPKVAEFEDELARACEVEHAVAVSSGTAALHLAVLALGLEPGDEVLVPAYTFPATANVVALAGLRPVLVDVDPETMNIDPARVEVGPRTKAVLAVHLFGRPGAARGAARRCRCSRTPPARSARAGAAARAARSALLGCLSFHPRKIVTTGEGGAVTTDDDADRRRGRAGCATTAGARSADADMPAPGLNYRLSDILCAVGIPQLRRLDELLAARTRIAAALHGAARATCRSPLPHADEGDVHGWQAYVDPGRATRRGAARAARAGDRGADRHLRAATCSRAYRDQGLFPGADARVRARARAAVPHALYRAASSTASRRPLTS